MATRRSSELTLPNSETIFDPKASAAGPADARHLASGRDSEKVLSVFLSTGQPRAHGTPASVKMPRNGNAPMNIHA